MRRRTVFERWVCLNGKVCLDEHAFIPVSDRGFLFGEGMFTTIRVHQGKCELINEHLLRLHSQARALGFEYAPSSFEWLEELIARNRAAEGTWRLKIIVTVHRDEQTGRLGNLLATLDPYESKRMEPSALCMYPYPLESPTAHLKSLSYLDHLQVKQYAIKQGFHDALTTSAKGWILETASSNIFWIEQEALWYPEIHLPYLKGICFNALLPHLQIPCRGVKATLDQIAPHASVYICNSLTHVRPVLSIGPRAFARNPQWESMLETAIEKALSN